MTENHFVLVIDDDPNLLKSLTDILNLHGFEAITTTSGKSAIEMAGSGVMDVALIDLNLADMPGLDVLSGIKSASPDTECMLLTGYASQDTAIEAVNRGAFAYFQKPFDIDMLILAIRRAIEKRDTLTALALSEARHQMVAGLTADYVYEMDVNEHGGLSRSWISDSFARITGYTPQEMDAQGGWETMIHPLDDGVFEGQVKRLLSNQPDYSEFRIIRKDGQVRWIEDFSRPISDEKTGRVIKVIGAARDITEKKLREMELQVIVEISEAMRTADTREEIQAILVEHMIDLLHLDGVTLEQLDPVNGEREIVCAGGMWSDLEGNIIPAGAGIGAQVIASGTARMIDDISKSNEVYNKRAFTGLKSAACIPLLIQDQPIGLFWVGSRQSLTEMDMRVMRSVAGMAANAIHRADLNEQTLRRLDELNALRAIDQAINNSLDINLTLEMIVRQLRQLCGGDAVDILVYRPALLTLTYAAGDGFRTDEIKKSSLRIGSGGAGRVALEQKPLWSEDIRKSKSECARKELVAAEEFIAYHACPLVVKGEIKGVLEVFHRQPFTAADEWKNILQTVATQAAIAIDNSEMFQGLQKLNTDLLLAYDETIEGWAAALELRDHDTEGHSRRVTECAVRMAAEAGFSQIELAHVRRGAILHDIGKIYVPDEILRKPGPLDDKEWIIMREHPLVAFELLSRVKYLAPALDIPYCHHERWDGKGYPRGLKGEEIPLAARLFAVADVYDALTSDRPYRKAWSRDKALEYIREQSGKHFDPKAVVLFFQTLED